MKIKEFILSRDLINQSNKLKGDTSVTVTPCEYYTLKYRHNGVENEIKWNTSDILSAYNDTDSDTKGVSVRINEDVKNKENETIVKDLVELTKLITDIVYSYEEVIELPDHILYI